MSGMFLLFFFFFVVIRTEVCTQATKKATEQERFAPSVRDDPAEPDFQTSQKRDIGRRFLSDGPLSSLSSLSPSLAVSSVINRLQLAFLDGSVRPSVLPFICVRSRSPSSSLASPFGERERERDLYCFCCIDLCPPEVALSPSLPPFCGCPLDRSASRSLAPEPT